MSNIEDRMLEYAQHDDYHVTQNLLIQGANEITRLRQALGRRLSPCSAHAFQTENSYTVCSGCPCDPGNPEHCG